MQRTSNIQNYHHSHSIVIGGSLLVHNNNNDVNVQKPQASCKSDKPYNYRSNCNLCHESLLHTFSFSINIQYNNIVIDGSWRLLVMLQVCLCYVLVYCPDCWPLIRNEAWSKHAAEVWLHLWQFSHHTTVMFIYNDIWRWYKRFSLLIDVDVINVQWILYNVCVITSCLSSHRMERLHWWKPSTVATEILQWNWSSHGLT